MKVLTTRDYDQFKTIPGNRPIDINHVNYLTKLNSENNLLWMFPATITKDNYLWDGQHRREVAKAQEWDFHYIISDKTLAELGDDIVGITNTAQKGWTLANFINYYARHNKEQYLFLEELMQQYKLPRTTVLALTTGSGQGKAIKQGNLSLYQTEEDQKVIHEMLEGYKVLQEIVPALVFGHKPFVLAIRTVFGYMSAEELKGEIIRANATLEKEVDKTEYLRQLERIVNYRRAGKNHVRFF